MSSCSCEARERGDVVETVGGARHPPSCLEMFLVVLGVPGLVLVVLVVAPPLVVLVIVLPKYHE